MSDRLTCAAVTWRHFEVGDRVIYRGARWEVYGVAYGGSPERLVSVDLKRDQEHVAGVRVVEVTRSVEPIKAQP